MKNSYKGLKVIGIPIDNNGYVKVEEFKPYGSEGYSDRYNYYLAEILGIRESENEGKKEIRRYFDITDGKMINSNTLRENHIYKASSWDNELKRQKSTYYLVAEIDETNIGVIEVTTYRQALDLKKPEKLSH